MISFWRSWPAWARSPRRRARSRWSGTPRRRAGVRSPQTSSRRPAPAVVDAQVHPDDVGVGGGRPAPQLDPVVDAGRPEVAVSFVVDAPAGEAATAGHGTWAGPRGIGSPPVRWERSRIAMAVR